MKPNLTPTPTHTRPGVGVCFPQGHQAPPKIAQQPRWQPGALEARPWPPLPGARTAQAPRPAGSPGGRPRPARPSPAPWTRGARGTRPPECQSGRTGNGKSDKGPASAPPAAPPSPKPDGRSPHCLGDNRSRKQKPHCEPLGSPSGLPRDPQDRGVGEGAPAGGPQAPPPKPSLHFSTRP